MCCWGVAFKNISSRTNKAPPIASSPAALGLTGLVSFIHRSAERAFWCLPAVFGGKRKLPAGVAETPATHRKAMRSRCPPTCPHPRDDAQEEVPCSAIVLRTLLPLWPSALAILPPVPSSRNKRRGGQQLPQPTTQDLCKMLVVHIAAHTDMVLGCGPLCTLGRNTKQGTCSQTYPHTPNLRTPSTGGHVQLFDLPQQPPTTHVRVVWGARGSPIATHMEHLQSTH